MSNTLQIKRRTSGSGALSALAVGELGVDLTDSNKLYVGSSSGNQLLNPSASTSYLALAGGTLTGQLYSQTIRPSATSTYNLGVATGRYAYVYGVTGDFSGSITAAGGTLSGNLNANGLEAGVWSGNGTFTGIFHSAQTGSEYCLISNDTNTILSASTGYGVFIRGGNNVSTYEIGVYHNQLPTAGGNTILTTASGLQLSGGSLTGDLKVGNTAVHLASAFSNQKGFSVNATTGRTDAVGNNVSGLQVGRYGGGGAIQIWRYASNQIGEISNSELTLNVPLRITNGIKLSRTSQYENLISCEDSGGNQTLKILGNRAASNASTGTDVRIGGEQNRTTGNAFEVVQGSSTYFQISSSGAATFFGNSITAGGGTLTGQLAITENSNSGELSSKFSNTNTQTGAYQESQGWSGAGYWRLGVANENYSQSAWRKTTWLYSHGGSLVLGANNNDRVWLTNTSFYPSTSGHDLGTNAQRWQLYATSGNFSGQAEIFNRLHLIGLTLDSSGTPSYIKIKTKIPFASSAADFTVNIKGFQYGSARTVDLKICWHYYNSTFYNPTISSSGGWLPTAQLSAEDDNGTDMVCIVLASPGYWPKMYVESAYSTYYGSSTNYFTGWTWTNAAASGTGNKLVTLTYNNKFGNVSVNGTLSGESDLALTGASHTLYSGSSDCTFAFGRSSSECLNMYVQDQHAYLTYHQDSDTNADHFVYFRNQAAGTGARGYIFEGGPIGIGMSPSTAYGLDVSGAVRISGNVALNSRLTFSYNSHYFEAGTNSVAFKNSSGTSYLSVNNTGTTVSGQVTASVFKTTSNTYTTTTDYELTDNGVIRASAGLWVAGNGINFGTHAAGSSSGGYNSAVTTRLSISNAGTVSVSGNLTVSGNTNLNNTVNISDGNVGILTWDTSNFKIRSQGSRGLQLGGGGTHGHLSISAAGAVTTSDNLTVGGTATVQRSSGDGILFLKNSAGSQILRLDQNSIRTTTNNHLTLFTNGNTNHLRLSSDGKIGVMCDPSATTMGNSKLIVAGVAQTGVMSDVMSVTVPNTAGNRGGYAVRNSAGGIVGTITGEVVTAGTYPNAVGKIDICVQNGGSSLKGLSIANNGNVSTPYRFTSSVLTVSNGATLYAATFSRHGSGLTYPDIYDAAGNGIVIGHNSSTAMLKVTSTGVGVGVTPSAKLHVYTSATLYQLWGNNSVVRSNTGSHGLRIYNNDSGGSSLVVQDDGGSNTPFIVKGGASGSVGIGTASPDYALDVRSSGATTLQVKSANNSDDTQLRLQSNAFFFNITNEGASGNITYISDDAQDQIWYTDNASNSSAERFRIKGGADTSDVVFSNSKVGIGIASPYAPLQVHNSADQAVVLSGATNPYIRWQSGSSNKAYVQWHNSNTALRFRNEVADIFEFMPDGSTGAVTLRMRGSDNDRWGEFYAHEGTSAAHEIGIIDGDGHWAIRHVKDTKTEWRINNDPKMTLTSTGLGIGSTNPQDKLNIHDSSSSANLGLKITRGSQTHGLRLGVNDSHAFLWTDQSQDLAFANDNAERLTIKASTGYVQVHQRLGVGTASPARSLHVQGTTSIVHIESSTANANASVWLKSNVGGTVANRWEIGTNISRGASLEIFDRLNSVSRLELTNGGNLGLGTGSSGPSAKLHVNGGSKFLGGGDWTNIERVTTTESYYSLFVTSTGTNANQAIARFSHSATAGSAGSGTETAVIARDKSYFYSKVGIGGATFNQTLTITNPSTGHWDRGLGFRLGSTDTAKIIVDSAGLKFRTFVGGDDFYFRNSANTTTFLITDAGNIGINKTPAGYGDTKLEVNGNVSGTRFLSGGTITNGTHAFEAYGSSFESSSIRLKETGAGENEDPGILFQKGNAASTGDHCGGIYFQGTSDLNYAIIRGTCAGSSKGQLNIHIGGQQNTITRTSNDTPVFQLGEGGLALGATPNDSYKLYVNGATYINSKLTVDGDIDLESMGDYITFYGDSGSRHSISSRDNSGNAADDLRINSYGALYVNLDSNDNNSSAANFEIGRHGGSASITDWLFTVFGETGKLKLHTYGSGNNTGTVAKYLGVTSAGVVVETDGTGSGGGSGSGTVNSGTAEQMAFYASNGTAVSGTSAFTFENSTDEEFNIGNGSSKGELCIGGGVGETSADYRLFVNGGIKFDEELCSESGIIKFQSNSSGTEATEMIMSSSGLTVNNSSSQTDSTYALYVSGGIKNSTGGLYVTGDGYISSRLGVATSVDTSYGIKVAGYIASYGHTTWSDYRLKDNTTLWNTSEAATLVKDVPVYSYRWNDNCEAKSVQDQDRIGFLAHEVSEKINKNNLVINEKDGEKYQSVNQTDMIPILWAALQDALKRIEELEAK